MDALLRYAIIPMNIFGSPLPLLSPVWYILKFKQCNSRTSVNAMVINNTCCKSPSTASASTSNKIYIIEAQKICATNITFAQFEYVFMFYPVVSYLPLSLPWPIFTSASRSVPLRPYWSSSLIASISFGTLSIHSCNTHALFFILLCECQKSFDIQQLKCLYSKCH